MSADETREAAAFTRWAERAHKWEVGASRTKDRSFGLSAQVDAGEVYLSANIGRRFLYALRMGTPPTQSPSDGAR